MIANFFKFFFSGPFTDSIRKMDNQEVRDIVCPASGVHIILPDYYSPANMVNFIFFFQKTYISMQKLYSS